MKIFGQVMISNGQTPLDFLFLFMRVLRRNFNSLLLLTQIFSDLFFSNFHIIPRVYMCLHFTCSSVLTVIYNKKYLKLITQFL